MNENGKRKKKKKKMAKRTEKLSRMLRNRQRLKFGNVTIEYEM